MHFYKDENNNLVISKEALDLKELRVGEIDAAVEKHVPVYEIVDGKLEVTVGSTLHPMTEEHYITCIFVVNGDEVNRVDLAPNDEPRASFDVVSGTIYAYCNLHGLWKADIK